MNNLKPENTEITIYSATWCGPCKMAKKFLTENGFSFNDIDIEKNNITRDEMAAMTDPLSHRNRAMFTVLLPVTSTRDSHLDDRD